MSWFAASHQRSSGRSTLPESRADDPGGGSDGAPDGGLDGGSDGGPDGGSDGNPPPPQPDSDSDDDPARYAAMAAAAQQVQALYDAGTPLFTREALRSLAQQLDAHGGAVRSGARNAVVAVRGMDGRTVQLPTASGAVAAATIHPDIVLVNVKPQTDYWPIEKLTGHTPWHVRRFDPARAFLALRVGHSQEARHRDPRTGAVRATGCRTVAELASQLAASWAASPAPAGTFSAGGTFSSSSPPSVHDVRAAFRRHRAAWEASDACQQLRATLRATLVPQLGTLLAVRSIVAFACSSMSDEREGGSARHAVQHAMVLTVRDVLEQAQAEARAETESKGESEGEGEGESKGATKPPPIACFAQDPAYDAADVAVLAEAGVVVLDDPHGFLAVDEASVVVAVAPSVPVRQIVADLARPAAMIWGRVATAAAAAEGDGDGAENDAVAATAAAAAPDASGLSALVEGRGGWLDPASPRVRQMLRDDYAEAPFPHDPRNFGTVDGVALYVRRASAPRAPPPPPPAVPLGWGESAGALVQRVQALLGWPG